MEKSSPLSGNFSVGNLLSFLAKKKARLLSKLVPGWTNNKIDSMLFIPKVNGTRAFRLPRGFKQFEIKTTDGKVQAYQTGIGPTVLFVHGWGGGAQQVFPIDARTLSMWVHGGVV